MSYIQPLKYIKPLEPGKNDRNGPIFLDAVGFEYPRSIYLIAKQIGVRSALEHRTIPDNRSTFSYRAYKFSIFEVIFHDA